MDSGRALVAVVDDDESVRESLPDFLDQLGYAARAFASAEEYLACDCIAATRCMILDVTMPGMTGPELQLELQGRGHAIPTIFITANAEDSLRARVLAQGAVACLFKPFTEDALLAALAAACKQRP